MIPGRFERLLTLVSTLISKKTAKTRRTISVSERLIITLLASGDDKQSLTFSYRLGRTTFNHILRETCGAIWMALGDIFVRPPSSPDDWREFSKAFEDLAKFPYCVGKIDGKHVDLRCPNNNGCLNYNNNGLFRTINGNLRFSLQFDFAR